jgi:hypothetical protein
LVVSSTILTAVKEPSGAVAVLGITEQAAFTQIELSSCSEYLYKFVADTSLVNLILAVVVGERFVKALATPPIVSVVGHAA